MAPHLKGPRVPPHRALVPYLSTRSLKTVGRTSSGRLLEIRDWEERSESSRDQPIAVMRQSFLSLRRIFEGQTGERVGRWHDPNPAFVRWAAAFTGSPPPVYRTYSFSYDTPEYLKTAGASLMRRHREVWDQAVSQNGVPLADSRRWFQNEFHRSPTQGNLEQVLGNMKRFGLERPYGDPVKMLLAKTGGLEEFIESRLSPLPQAGEATFPIASASFNSDERGMLKAAGRLMDKAIVESPNILFQGVRHEGIWNRGVDLHSLVHNVGMRLSVAVALNEKALPPSVQDYYESLSQNPAGFVKELWGTLEYQRRELYPGFIFGEFPYGYVRTFQMVEAMDHAAEHFNISGRDLLRSLELALARELRGYVDQAMQNNFPQNPERYDLSFSQVAAAFNSETGLYQGGMPDLPERTFLNGSYNNILWPVSVLVRHYRRYGNEADLNTLRDYVRKIRDLYDQVNLDMASDLPPEGYRDFTGDQLERLATWIFYKRGFTSPASLLGLTELELLPQDEWCDRIPQWADPNGLASLRSPHRPDQFSAQHNYAPLIGYPVGTAATRFAFLRRLHSELEQRADVDPSHLDRVSSATKAHAVALQEEFTEHGDNVGLFHWVPSYVTWAILGV
jgi:hypothetical protein